MANNSGSTALSKTDAAALAPVLADGAYMWESELSKSILDETFEFLKISRDTVTTVRRQAASKTLVCNTLQIEQVHPQIRLLAISALIAVSIRVLEGYDARIRVGALRAAHRLAIPPHLVTTVERALAVKLASNLKSATPDADAVRQSVKSSSAAKWRMLKIGAGIAAGAGLLVVTGGLAAPLIVPAIGGMVGLVASVGTAIGAGAIAGAVAAVSTTVLSSVTTVTIVTIFGIGGGYLVGSRVKRRTCGLRDWTVVPHPVALKERIDAARARRARAALGGQPASGRPSARSSVASGSTATLDGLDADDVDGDLIAAAAGRDNDNDDDDDAIGAVRDVHGTEPETLGATPAHVGGMRDTFAAAGFIANRGHGGASCAPWAPRSARTTATANAAQPTPTDKSADVPGYALRACVVVPGFLFLSPESDPLYSAECLGVPVAVAAGRHKDLARGSADRVYVSPAVTGHAHAAHVVHDEPATASAPVALTPDAVAATATTTAAPSEAADGAVVSPTSPLSDDSSRDDEADAVLRYSTAAADVAERKQQHSSKSRAIVRRGAIASAQRLLESLAVQQSAIITATRDIRDAAASATSPPPPRAAVVRAGGAASAKTMGGSKDPKRSAGAGAADAPAVHTADDFAVWLAERRAEAAAEQVALSNAAPLSAGYTAQPIGGSEDELVPPARGAARGGLPLAATARVANEPPVVTEARICATNGSVDGAQLFSLVYDASAQGAVGAALRAWIGWSVARYVGENAAGLALPAVAALSAALFLPLGVLTASRLIDQAEGLAYDRADKAAAPLAESLRQYAFGRRPVTLVATSAGCYAVMRALEILADAADEADAAAAAAAKRPTLRPLTGAVADKNPSGPPYAAGNAIRGLVDRVILLGAAVPLSETSLWRKAASVVRGPVVNVYSKHDTTLHLWFRAFALGKALAGAARLPEPLGSEPLRVRDTLTYAIIGGSGATRARAAQAALCAKEHGPGCDPSTHPVAYDSDDDHDATDDDGDTSPSTALRDTINSAERIHRAADPSRRSDGQRDGGSGAATATATAESPVAPSTARLLSSVGLPPRTRLADGSEIRVLNVDASAIVHDHLEWHSKMSEVLAAVDELVCGACIDK